MRKMDPVHIATGGEPCVYFNTPRGCWFGDECKFTHIKGVVPQCKFYRGPGTCRFGESCYFSHADPQKIHSSAEMVLHESASDWTDYTSHTESENTDNLSGDETKDTKEDSSAVEPEGTNTESEQLLGACAKDEDSQLFKVKTIKCGECGKIISMKESGNVDDKKKVNNTGDEDDDPCDENDDTCDDYSSVNTSDLSDYEYNELEQHYYDMILKMDKDHLHFLKKDPLFQQVTFCGVCGRMFGRARHLLHHITDKVKGSTEDSHYHKEFLDSIIIDFSDRDRGIIDEKECMEALLLHLGSYSGSSDDSGDERSLPELLGLMAIHSHLQSSDCSDDDNLWGFDEDDMFELACQGIKPWDPEAGMALAVLNGGIRF